MPFAGFLSFFSASVILDKLSPELSGLKKNQIRTFARLNFLLNRFLYWRVFCAMCNNRKKVLTRSKEK